MKIALRWIIVAIVSAAWVTPAGTQFLEKPTRPQVETPKGAVRQIIFKSCTSCHGIDDYAYYAMDRAGWEALLEEKHKNLKGLVSDPDRGVLLDWLVTKFGPSTKPFPRAYVPPTITTFFGDDEAQALLGSACISCHGMDRVNEARHSPDRWRVIAVDMRQRGAKLTDEDLERLVEWLGRVKGTNPNQ